MDRVSNVTYKVNTEIKNGCKETMFRIYFLTYEDTFYCRAREAIDLSPAFITRMCFLSPKRTLSITLGYIWACFPYN